MNIVTMILTAMFNGQKEIKATNVSHEDAKRAGEHLGKQSEYQYRISIARDNKFTIEVWK